MSDIIVGIATLVGLFLFGGAWQRGRQMRQAKLDRLEAERKIEKVRQDAQNTIGDDADAARDWLRDD